MGWAWTVTITFRPAMIVSHRGCSPSRSPAMVASASVKYDP
jgi:hypothetical protein